MDCLIVAIILLLPIFWLAVHFTDSSSKRLCWYCFVFGHRFFFNVSFPELESGRVYCKRCGKVEYIK